MGPCYWSGNTQFPQASPAVVVAALDLTGVIFELKDIDVYTLPIIILSLDLGFSIQWG